MNRQEVDRKNQESINKIISNYPKVLENYINSMERKTSYTKLVYSRYVRNFLDYINSEYNINIFDLSAYNNIKPMIVDSYMIKNKFNEEGEEKSGMYRAAQLAAIKGFFDYLQRNDIITNNPCDNVEIPKDSNNHEIITITEEDLNIIMYNIENGVGSFRARERQRKWRSRDKAIVFLGISTGLRVGAIVGIDIDDIDFLNKCIYVTEKGKRGEKIYIGERTIKLLKEWIQDRNTMISSDEKALFIQQGNTRISVRTVEERFKALSFGTGKKLTPHKMRATCATKLYEETGDIYLVQQQLGHKSVKNTERYARVSDERKIKAANILDSIY